MEARGRVRVRVQQITADYVFESNPNYVYFEVKFASNSICVCVCAFECRRA